MIDMNNPVAMAQEIANQREQIAALCKVLAQLDRALVHVSSAYTATGMDAWSAVTDAIIEARAALAKVKP